MKIKSSTATVRAGECFGKEVISRPFRLSLLVLLISGDLLKQFTPSLSPRGDK